MSKPKKSIYIDPLLGLEIPGGGPHDATIHFGGPGGHVEVDDCIYCGTNDNLTDEHPIPYSLGGRAKVKSGSCRACADIINRDFEQPLLRHAFKGPRQYLGLPTRSSKKEKRWDGKADLVDDQNVIVGRAPLNQTPVTLALAYYDYMPGLLGRENAKFQANQGKHNLKLIAINNGAPMQTEHWTKSVKLTDTWFSKLVCKIALGEVIRRIDPGIRDSYLSDFILGKSKDSSDFLGARIEKPKSSFVVDVGVPDRLTLVRAKPTPFYVTVRLFGFFEGPTYYIAIRPDGW